MRYPGALWIGPTDNSTKGGQENVFGLVTHIMEGTEAGTESWFHNATAKASSHFLNPKVGMMRQMVDTADRAWAQAAGNTDWLSVENEGHSGDHLTASQMENIARLYVWMRKEYGVPLKVTHSTSVHGLGYHGMGGVAWGNHPDCPGQPVINQLTGIMSRVLQILNPLNTIRKANHMVIVAPIRSTVPKGTEWPGDFLLTEAGILLHIDTTEDLAHLQSMYIPGPIGITYTRFQQLQARG